MTSASRSNFSLNHPGVIHKKLFDVGLCEDRSEKPWGWGPAALKETRHGLFMLKNST